MLLIQYEKEKDHTAGVPRCQTRRHQPLCSSEELFAPEHPRHSLSWVRTICAGTPALPLLGERSWSSEIATSQSLRFFCRMHTILASHRVRQCLKETVHMSLLEQYTYQCTQSMRYPLYYYSPTSWILKCQFTCQKLRTTTTNTANSTESSLSRQLLHFPKAMQSIGVYCMGSF